MIFFNDWNYPVPCKRCPLYTVSVVDAGVQLHSIALPGLHTWRSIHAVILWLNFGNLRKFGLLYFAVAIIKWFLFFFCLKFPYPINNTIQLSRTIKSITWLYLACIIIESNLDYSFALLVSISTVFIGLVWDMTAYEK